MPDAGPRAAIPLVRCGAIAREVLADAGETRVIASFERSFYLACPRGIVCIGTPGIGAGPIQAEVSLPEGMTWATLGIMPEARGETSGDVTAIGDGLLLDIATGSTWLPPPMPDFEAMRVRRGTIALRNHARAGLPDEGFARLIFGDPVAERDLSAMMKAARGPLDDLQGALRPSLDGDTWRAEAVQAATLLVGLGPGFTPSGDDVLGGLLLALTSAGRIGLRDALWQALEPELDALTVPASAMHLSAAADGMAGEPVHLLLNAILRDDVESLPAHLQRVAAIGHTSGWDCLAGLVMGLEALAEDVV